MIALRIYRRRQNLKILFLVYNILYSYDACLFILDGGDVVFGGD